VMFRKCAVDGASDPSRASCQKNIHEP
jgi:hypothetical protein